MLHYKNTYNSALYYIIIKPSPNLDLLPFYNVKHFCGVSGVLLRFGVIF